MAAKKKPALTPEAAKILEQYRNAGNKAPVSGGGPNGDDANTTAAKPSAPPPAATHRSGTRGK